MEEIIRAAKTARAHEFIMEMPEGYDTVIGERGLKLSGGQKQRLSIARAVLRNTPILILDEATAAVDVETEAKIQQAIQELTENRTIIVVAHRLSTVKKADTILVIEDGKIVESGNHSELYSYNGVYRHCATSSSGMKNFLNYGTLYKLQQSNCFRTARLSCINTDRPLAVRIQPKRSMRTIGKQKEA